MAIPFVPDDFEVPTGLSSDHFRLEPLGPQHNERDHEAWMSNIEHIRSTPGYPDGNWPSAIPLAENLVDLERHAEDFTLRKGFTYSVLIGDDIIGCVYLYPTKKAACDVEALSWVIAGKVKFDKVLWETVSTWLAEAWPFQRILYESR